MISGNSKWVRAVLTTAVILAITAMTVPAMASIPGVTFTIPPTSYNISGYVIYITVPPKTSSTGMLYVYLNSSDTGPYFYVTAIPANAMGGATNVPIMLPYNIKAGNYTIYVNGTPVSEFTTSPYTKGNVSSPFELKFTISPGFASPGQTVTLNVTGWGFTPGETVVIELGNPTTGATQTIYTTTANTWGFVNATVSFTAPSSPGEYYIIAVGQLSGVTYIAPFYVTTAYVTPSLMAVYNGYNYTLKGFNFPQGTYVDICFNGVVFATEKLVSTTGTASFNVTIPIQYLPFGNYSIVAISTLSPAPVGALCPGANETYEGGYANATWTVVPQIVLSTTQTCTGSTVYISGSGFPANKEITIYVNKTLFTIPATTSPYGTFTTTFTPPKPGTYNFTTSFTYTYSVVGSVNKSATYPMLATLTVPSPTISISPSEQIVGGLVTITGTCLPPSTLVKVSIGPVNATNLALNSSSTWTKVQTYITPTGIYKTGYVETNPSGSFSGRYVVPLLQPGTYTVNVSVGSIQWSTSLTIPSPTISFSSTHTNIISAYEGEEIHFVGQNFANFTLGYNMTIKLMTIKLSGYTATCQNNTLVPFGPYGELYCEMFRNGTVVGTITMPVVQPGTYTVYFNGTFWSHAFPPGANATITYFSNDTLYTTANITMMPSSITVTPSPAPAGSPVSVTGQYFYPGTTVNIYVYLNGTTLVTSIMNVPVGSNGEFTATFTAPNVQSGYLYIVAEESQSQYIAGTVGYATANVTITNVHVVIINLLNEVLSDLKNMNSTLYEVLGNLLSINSTLYGAIQSVGSMVTNVNNTLTYYAGQILGSLSNIQNTLSNVQSTLNNIQTALSQGFLTLSVKLGVISSTLSTIQSNTVNILGNLTKMNATLTAVYSTVQSMGSELSSVYKAVLSVNSTLQSMSSTLSSIGSTLSSMQSTLSSMNTTLVKIYDAVSTLNLTVIQNELSTINNNVLSVNSTLTTYAGQIMSGLGTVQSALSGVQSTLSAISNNVLGVNSTLTTYAGQIMSGLGTVQSALNSTLTYYAGQVLSNLYNIENTLGTMQSTMSSQYSTIQGELGAIESTLVSMNNTLVSKVSTVPSVVSGGGSYTFTSPGAYTIYQGSGVAQITVTLYYTGYTTAYIYVYPIPGDTTHVVKLQVTSSAGYTVTVSGWRVDIYVTSAWPYSPVTVYYSYTAIS